MKKNFGNRKRLKIGVVAAGYDGFADIFPGVFKKINRIQAEFIRYGMDANIISVPYGMSLADKVRRRLPFGGDGCDWHILSETEWDVLYIRRPQFISSGFVSALKNVKSKYPETLILLEYPTYPYAGEYRSLFNLPILLKDTINKRKLKKVVDRIVDLSQHDVIDKIKTIQIINGIDLNEVRPRVPRPENPKKLELVMAASFAPWHGADRLLRGLGEYNGSTPITVHLVGDGSESKKLKRIVKDLGIQDSVVFHGWLGAEQMNKIYNESTLGVGCLAITRKGPILDSSLKTREYLAKGLPFIYADKVDVMQREPADFCLEVEAGEAPIRFDDIVAFWKELYRDGETSVVERTRSYAERNVGMPATMASVESFIVDYFDPNKRKSSSLGGM